MKYLTILLHFFQGTYAKFGTSSNLIREVMVSVLTAVSVAIFVQLLTPSTPSPVGEVHALLTTTLASQHRADSILNLMQRRVLITRIDSLQYIIQKHDEQDSMRANAGLSDLDAMRKVNRTIANDMVGKLHHQQSGR